MNREEIIRMAREAELINKFDCTTNTATTNRPIRSNPPSNCPRSSSHRGVNVMWPFPTKENPLKPWTAKQVREHIEQQIKEYKESPL